MVALVQAGDCFRVFFPDQILRHFEISSGTSTSAVLHEPNTV
jgi:hypothetical protein